MLLKQFSLYQFEYLCSQTPTLKIWRLASRGSEETPCLPAVSDWVPSVKEDWRNIVNIPSLRFSWAPVGYHISHWIFSIAGFPVSNAAAKITKPRYSNIPENWLSTCLWSREEPHSFWQLRISSQVTRISKYLELLSPVRKKSRTQAYTYWEDSKS